MPSVTQQQSISVNADLPSHGDTSDQTNSTENTPVDLENVYTLIQSCYNLITQTNTKITGVHKEISVINLKLTALSEQITNEQHQSFSLKTIHLEVWNLINI